MQTRLAEQSAARPAGPGARRRPARPRGPFAEALVAGVLAGAVAGLLIVVGPPGFDLAAHVYQRRAFMQRGLFLWDNYWYSGRYGLAGYSVLYYPLAALIGITWLGILSIAAAAAGFAGAVAALWGRAGRWGSLVFAISWGAMVLSGSYPFLLGAALGLLGLWGLVTARSAGRARRRLALGAFGAAALGTLAASALALLALDIVLAGALLALGRTRQDGARLALPALGIAGALSLVELVVLRAFPGGGYYPFWWEDLAQALAFSALGLLLARRVRGSPVLRMTLVVYAFVCIVAFVVRSDLGANMARLRFAAVAAVVLLASLRSWRPRAACVGAVALAAGWNLPPLVAAFGPDGPAAGASASYWAPAVSYLHSHLRPSYRVEAVDTAGHWPAAWLAGAGIPLVRGWFRQDDLWSNQLLYRPGPLGSKEYLGWLRDNAVEYVVLSDAAPDFSSAQEDALLRSGQSGLRPVFRSGSLTVFAVPRPRPMVTGPHAARVERLGGSSMIVDIGGPGTYRVAVHWTPYWRPSLGCAEPGPGGMTRLVERRGGRVVLSFGFGLSRAILVVEGRAGRSCAPG